MMSCRAAAYTHGCFGNTKIELPLYKEDCLASACICALAAAAIALSTQNADVRQGLRKRERREDYEAL